MILDLKNQEIELRELRTADSDQIARLINNKNVWDNLKDYVPFPYSKEDALSFIQFCLNQKPLQHFGIYHSGKVCGVISIVPQSDVHRLSGELGYWIGESFWNKGIATQAVSMISEYAFEKLGLNRIYAKVFDPNVASMKVLEKCGYLLEGISKNAVIKNNRVLDEHRYALLKP